MCFLFYWFIVFRSERKLNFSMSVETRAFEFVILSYCNAQSLQIKIYQNLLTLQEMFSTRDAKF